MSKAAAHDYPIIYVICLNIEMPSPSLPFFGSPCFSPLSQSSMFLLFLLLSFVGISAQLNGWRLFNVTSHCLASRLSRGATINTISSNFFDKSLLIPLAQAANSLNIHRALTRGATASDPDSGHVQTDLSVDQVRRALFCRVIHHLHENTWNSKRCFRQYETASTPQFCAQCTASKPS